MNEAGESERLDWVEKAALENIKGHIKSAEDMKRESNGALTVILAGAAGSLAYAAKFLEAPSQMDLAVAFGALAFYLFALGATLVHRCLRIGEFPPPTNEPAHLNQKQYSVNRLREVELRNMQRRIEAAAAINESTAGRLNRIWMAATASPLVAAIAFFLSHLCHGLS
jgi:hypothetical protein